MENRYKNSSEESFASYLKQEGISVFEYEPYGDGGSNPDFCFQKDGLRVLVEIKQKDAIPIDVVLRSRNSTGSLDPRTTWDSIRDTIDDACAQLKPRKDDVDFCVIILGRPPNTFAIDEQTLFAAMFGDPKFLIPLGSNGLKSGDPFWSNKINGALLKNREGTPTPIHDYVGGVGIVDEFSPYSYFIGKGINEEYERLKRDAIPEDRQTEIIIQRLFDGAIRKAYVPGEFQDENNKAYRLTMIINPLSKRPIPLELFSGIWNKIINPKVV